MQVKVQIVEDDPLTAHDLKEILTESGFQVVGITRSYKEALQMYETQQPDVMLVDIMLNGAKDGVELVDQINGNGMICPVVYLTGNSDPLTKSRAFNTDPVVFLTKPFSKNNVTVSLELAFDKFHKQSNDVKKELLIKNGEQFLKVPMEDILYLQAQGSYSVIVISKGRYLQSGNLVSFERKLTDHFIRVHRSFLVNKDKITAINAHYVYIDDIFLPIGRRFKENLKKL